MKRLGVIINREKDEGFRYTKLLVDSIKRRGGDVKIKSTVARDIGIDDEGLDEEEVLSSSEVIICLGGDGTFLRVARKAYDKKVPLLGINLGTLGFLTEVEKSEIESTVESLIEDKYVVEERMMLETSITREGNVIARDIALNDVVISRGALSRILRVKTYINGAFVDSFPGDGVIISSPTGSTAYSLSAGGPIVEPDANLIIITPICPHILYSRSVITTGERVVKAVVDENYCHSAMVTVDGQKGIEIRGGDIIETKKAKHCVKIIRVKEGNFFNVLRSKIYDRGENLKKNEI